MSACNQRQSEGRVQREEGDEGREGGRGGWRLNGGEAGMGSVRGARGGSGHTLMRATRRWAMREARLEGSSAWLFGHTLLEVAV